mgnify:CR=1 FL=1
MREGGVPMKFWAVVGGVALLFLLFVWPGMTTYAVLTAANGQALLRVNKITGKVQMVANTFPAPPPQAAAQAPAVPTQ